jgi:hypothetical protein
LTYSPVAQLVERVAVNHLVGGSSPSRGARIDQPWGVAAATPIFVREHGFRAAGAYLSKCHLCLDIRRYLIMVRELTFPELAPRGFYENL